MMRYIVESALYYSGLPYIFRNKNRRKVTIVNYHDPPVDVFRKHLGFYASHYHFISIDSLFYSLTKGDFSDLPNYPLIITFDDGHIGNYHLLTLLKDFKVPAVIYVTSGLIGTRRHFWWKELRRHDLNDKINELKKLSFLDFQRELKELCDYEFDREYDTPDALTFEHIREFQKAGITVAAHSVNHPILNLCSDNEVYYECSESKKILEDIIQCEIKDFALPNGDYDQRVIDIIKKVGFKTNRTTLPVTVAPDTSPLELGNFGVSDYARKSLLSLQVSGCWDRIRTFIR